MNYVHKWVNDEARYFAVDANGSSYEYLNKPTYKHRFNLPARWENGIKMWSVSVCFNDAKPADSLQQRYTDQQLELETQGWTLWNAGDDKPNTDGDLMSDVWSDGCESIALYKYGYWEWGENSSIIAHKLSNSKGYKDGVRIEKITGTDEAWEEGELGRDEKYVRKSSNDKLIDEALRPEWKAGKLPPLNTECEFLLNSKWEAIKTVGKDGERAVFYYSELHRYDASKNPDKFRPLQSERDKVIAKAYAVTCETIGNPDTVANSEYRTTLLSALYDAGCLIDPDKGES